MDLPTVSQDGIVDNVQDSKCLCALVNYFNLSYFVTKIRQVSLKKGVGLICKYYYIIYKKLSTET